MQIGHNLPAQPGVGRAPAIGLRGPPHHRRRVRSDLRSAVCPPLLMPVAAPARRVRGRTVPLHQPLSISPLRPPAEVRDE